MMQSPPNQFPRKGRGAIGNPPVRFETERRQPVDDGWGHDDPDEPPPLPTVVVDERARSIITRNDSPDIPFEQSINPYRGCEHGCIYCFARPTHAYLGLSPGLEFETKLFAKPDAARLLEAELRRPGYRPTPIVLGTATDPYQPIERTRRLTRDILRVLADYRHPVAVVTKSALVERDLDILAEMAEQGLAAVAVSVTTLDPHLARTMEPRASQPKRRLGAIRELSAAGIPVSVLAAPMIPFVNDHELEAILQAAAEAGASSAGYVLIRLPHELKELFGDWLAAHFPDRAARVLAQIRACRGGTLYIADWGARMTGRGEYARLLGDRFRLACRRLGFAHGTAASRPLDVSRFRLPPRAGDQLLLL